MIPPALLSLYRDFRKQHRNNLWVTAEMCARWAREALISQATQKLSPLSFRDLSSKHGNDYKYEVTARNGKQVWLWLCWHDNEEAITGYDWKLRKPTDTEYNFSKCSGNSRCVYIDRHNVLEPAGHQFKDLIDKKLSKQVAYEEAVRSWNTHMQYARDLWEGHESDGSWTVYFFDNYEDFENGRAVAGDYMDHFTGDGQNDRELANLIRKKLQSAPFTN